MSWPGTPASTTLNTPHSDHRAYAPVDTQAPSAPAEGAFAASTACAAHGAFRTFDDVQDHLDRLGLFHMDFSLDRMRRAVAALGLEAAAPRLTVQVLGTNGKGSTSTFLASLARAHGLKAGLYTSPHFITPRERVRLDGHMLPAGEWPVLASQVYAAAPELTYFEFLTVLGYLAFARAGVDVAIMEAGLGGRYDATTALPADVLGYTPVSLDHQSVLGPTPVAIAEDKAGAVRSTAPVFTAPQRADVLEVLRRAAVDAGAPLTVTSPEAAAGCPLGLAGPHQQTNAALALALWREAAARLGLASSPEAERQGLAAARIAGRLHWQAPYLLDGAHNEAGLASLRDALLAADARPAAVIFSCLADKDLEAMLPLVLEAAQGAPLFTPTIIDNERAMLGEDLAARLRAMGARAEGCDRLSHAVKLARAEVGLHGAATDPVAGHPLCRRGARDLVLVCGSLYLLGEWFTRFPEEV